MGTPNLENCSIGTQMLDAVIHRISHIQAAIRGYSDAAR